MTNTSWMLMFSGVPRRAMDETKRYRTSVTLTLVLVKDDDEEGGNDRKHVVSEVCATYRYTRHRAATPIPMGVTDP